MGSDQEMVAAASQCASRKVLATTTIVCGNCETSETEVGIHRKKWGKIL